MANYQTLKAAINAVIKANGNKEITGTVLNEVLLAMVNSLGAGYQFAGVATPETNPGTPDQNVFYLAGQAGTYTNFGGIAIPDGITVLSWNGSWVSNIILRVDDVLIAGSDNLATSGVIWSQVNYRLIKLSGWSPTNNIAAPHAGDIGFNTNTKKLLRRLSETFEFDNPPFIDGAIYQYQNKLYIWNGTDMQGICEGIPFGDVVHPDADPGILNGDIFYLAKVAGTYTNFGGIEIHDGEVGLLMWSAASQTWSKASVSVPKKEDVNNNCALLGTREAKLVSPVFNDGYYISTSGLKTPHSLYTYTEPVAVSAGEIILFECMASDGCAVISESDRDGDNIIPKVVGKNDSQYTQYGYIAKKNGYVILSGAKTTINNVKIIYNILSESIANTGNETPISIDEDRMIIDTTPLNIIKDSAGLAGIFHDWGMIGDSLNSGMIYKSLQVFEYARQWSWGEVLRRLCGSRAVQYSIGGLTCKTWWDKYITNGDKGWQISGEDSYFATDVHTSYTIALGTNDVDYLSEYANGVGTIADIDLANYNNNADSFAGWYGKIIQKIKELRVNARIFVVTIPTLWKNTVETEGLNAVIRQLPTIFDNVYLLDMQQNLPYSNALKAKYISVGHMTSQGYQWFGYAMATYIDYIVRTYPDNFKFMGLVGKYVDDGTL